MNHSEEKGGVQLLGVRCLSESKAVQFGSLFSEECSFIAGKTVFGHFWALERREKGGGEGAKEMPARTLRGGGAWVWGQRRFRSLLRGGEGKEQFPSGGETPLV